MLAFVIACAAVVGTIGFINNATVQGDNGECLYAAEQWKASAIAMAKGDVYGANDAALKAEGYRCNA